MTKPRKKQSRKKSPPTDPKPAVNWLWPSLALLVILGGVGLLLFMSRTPAPVSSTAAPDEPNPTAVALEPLPFGRGDYCRIGPTFPGDLAFGSQSYVGTSLRGYMGLTLSDSNGRVYQDPTWDDAGFLGSFVYDRLGNIYTAPAPFINVSNNPPEEQNKIYQVDTTSGAMAEWVDLPAVQAPNELNPFGILGLFYDCDTDSVFAGSVAGSTAAEEVGRIFRIDRARTEVAATYEGVDAMGVGVFNGAGGKRLYFGSGRDSGVRSIELDEAGDFVGEPRVEFYLAQFEEGGNEKAQRITFTPDNQMVVKGLEFDYNLRAASEPERVLYTLRYDSATDAWALISIERS